MGLADARRPVEQQTALEMLAGRPQPLAVAGDADDLAAQVGERGLGQDEVRVRQVRALVEPEQRVSLAEHAAPEGHHLAPVDVELDRELTQPVGRLASCPLPGRDDLESDALLAALRVGTAHEQHESLLALGDQDDGRSQTLAGRAPGSARQADPGDVPGPNAVKVERVGVEQVGESERPAVSVGGQADELVAAGRFREPAVERRLHVDMLVRRPRLLDDRQLVCRHAEMVPDDRAEGGPVGRAGLGDEPPDERAAVAPDVRDLEAVLAVDVRRDRRRVGREAGRGWARHGDTLGRSAGSPPGVGGR
ncbi:hypothetical protein GCM10009798_31130 [Nocardioides panacihumi]|uniref:Uncharacterized protein n=1 Tax=Nocardioides panacihumi TaxID=400774 RepID=A0ABN2RFU5_9ACTN